MFYLNFAKCFYLVRIVLVELTVFTVYCLYCNVCGLVVLLLNKFDLICFAPRWSPQYDKTVYRQLAPKNSRQLAYSVHRTSARQIIDK